MTALTFYRPQRSCGKVMFLHLSVSHSVHGGGGVPASVHARIPPQADTPGKHTILPGSTPSRKHTSRNQTPPESTPPREAHPLGSILPQEAHPSTVTAVEGTHPTGMLSSFSQHYNAVADPGFTRWDGIFLPKTA